MAAVAIFVADNVLAGRQHHNIHPQYTLDRLHKHFSLESNGYLVGVILIQITVMVRDVFASVEGKMLSIEYIVEHVETEARLTRQTK